MEPELIWSWRTRLLAGAFVVLVCAALFEIACQVYAYTVVFPRFDTMMTAANHYYVPSEGMIAYQLQPGVTIQSGNRTLRINRWGIREQSDSLFPDRRKVAVLGDSVTFGTGSSQERTISAFLQSELDPATARIKVLNFGLGGLNVAELAELLRLKDAVYDVDEVVYLLNPNDFSRRSSVYEGADTGMYRAYRRPVFKSVWFVRKLIYRLVKGGATSVRWYQWFFDGNEQYGYGHIREMVEYGKENGIRFSVVLFPVGIAYTEDGYALAEMYRKIGKFLHREGIPFVDPTEELGPEARQYFDHTDHLNDAGNAVIARIMGRLIRELDREGAGA